MDNLEPDQLSLGGMSRGYKVTHISISEQTPRQLLSCGHVHSHCSRRREVGEERSRRPRREQVISMCSCEFSDHTRAPSYLLPQHATPVALGSNAAAHPSKEQSSLRLGVEWLSPPAISTHRPPYLRPLLFGRGAALGFGTCLGACDLPGDCRFCLNADTSLNLIAPPLVGITSGLA